MAKIIKPNPDPISAGLRAAQGLKSDVPSIEQVDDGIQAHLQGFVDVHASREHGEAVITARSTKEMLNALGLATFAGGHILTKPFSIPQGHASYAELDRMKEGIRDKDKGINADTGMYDPTTGHINADKAVAFWKEIAGDKNFITAADVNSFVAGAKKRDLFGGLYLREVGKVINETELRLFFDLTAQVNDKGEQVVTPDRLVAFLDGTLWQDLAKARQDGTLYQPRPVGEIVHEGARKVAKGLAQLASTYGGSADAGTLALNQANLTIDVDASLDQQQSTKTLAPTILGAMRALCPLGYG